MKRKHYAKFLGAAVIVSTSVLLSLPTTATANDHETQCFNNIQGKIPWNDDKNMNWEPENIKQLCKGTTQPAEPGACFLSVLNGRVNWGKGIDWDWKNIINLCSGTNNSAKTVECFQNATAKGVDWRDAILFCQRTDK